MALQSPLPTPQSLPRAFQRGVWRKCCAKGRVRRGAWPSEVLQCPLSTILILSTLTDSKTVAGSEGNLAEGEPGVITRPQVASQREVARGVLFAIPVVKEPYKNFATFRNMVSRVIAKRK